MPREYTREWELADEERDKLKAENETLQRWVNELQSGMYINCVYCGYRYGPSLETPVAMADVLKEHIEKCPKHPMSALKAEVEHLKADIEKIGTADDPMWVKACELKAENESLKSKNELLCSAIEALKGANLSTKDDNQGK